MLGSGCISPAVFKIALSSVQFNFEYYHAPYPLIYYEAHLYYTRHLKSVITMSLSNYNKFLFYSYVRSYKVGISTTDC